jgi:hypothetical protein
MIFLLICINNKDNIIINLKFMPEKLSPTPEEIGKQSGKEKKRIGRIVDSRGEVHSYEVGKLAETAERIQQDAKER